MKPNGGKSSFWFCCFVSEGLSVAIIYLKIWRRTLPLGNKDYCTWHCHTLLILLSCFFVCWDNDTREVEAKGSISIPCLPSLSFLAHEELDGDSLFAGPCLCLSASFCTEAAERTSGARVCFLHSIYFQEGWRAKPLECWNPVTQRSLFLRDACMRSHFSLTLSAGGNYN